MYPDSAGNGLANGWCGAGIQTAPVFGPVFTVNVALRWDELPSGVTPMVLAMVRSWQEGANDVLGQFPVSEVGNDWFLLTYEQTAAKIILSVNGVPFQSIDNQAGDGVNVNEADFCENQNSNIHFVETDQDQMFVSLQIQTGDPYNPDTDSSITEANAIKLQVDWIAIDIPTAA
jgi:hypothetical protein